MSWKRRLFFLVVWLAAFFWVAQPLSAVRTALCLWLAFELTWFRDEMCERQ